MDKSKEAYQYGKRLGKESITKEKGKQFLKNSRFQWKKVNAILRELAGYEDTETYSNFTNEGYKPSSFRKEKENSKEILNNTVIPSFRKGFYEGLNN
jgi:hypothetical protein